jgi:hypothetical protein
MAQLDHAKIHRRDVGRQSHEPRPAHYKTRWLPIGFGPQGATMPTLLFTYPQRLELIKEGAIIHSRSDYAVELVRQARVVCNRAERIVAPVRYGEKTRFAIIADANDVLERVVLVSTSTKSLVLPFGSKIVKRAAVLSVSIASEFKDRKLSYKHMASSLRDMFTNKSGGEPLEWQCERFVQNDDNFELSGIREHAYL